MPATRSRTSTETPEVAVEEKKTEVPTKGEEEQPKKEAEAVKEVVTEEKTESNSAEQSNDSTSADEKPVDKSEENTNGSTTTTTATTTTDALPSDTNGDKTEDKVENGAAKRKSVAEEAGDAPDSTDITPKKAKVGPQGNTRHTPVADDNVDSNGAKEAGTGEEAEKQTAVETTA